ncbi:glycosyltransferase family 4 protein [Rubrolithibacter danxiaensis]|uniref:glycosyltransferase family 4 protein n=1 Tax=Rubrolithibacter danxiaensis TaxID=3390805 RepID=UPI003BF7D970
MKIAYLVPSLINKAPIIVVKELVEGLVNKLDKVVVFYFDDIVELDFPCATIKINQYSPYIELFTEFDVIHAHMLRPNLYVAYFKNKIHGAVVATLHNYIYEDISSSHGKLIGIFTRYIWIRALKRFDIVVCLSNTMLEYYSKHISKSKLIYIYNGRSLTLNSCENKDADIVKIEKLRLSYKVIGGVGNMRKIKGFHQLINLLVLNGELALVLIGNGKAMEELVKMAKSMGVTERCIFLGYKRFSLPYFKYFDIYGMVSYSEGFPLVALEAAGAGIPLVCSDLPIFRELFNEEEACFFQLNDISSLNEAVSKALGNPVFYSANVKSKFLNCYRVKLMCNNYLELYNSVKKR